MLNSLFIKKHKNRVKLYLKNPDILSKSHYITKELFLYLQSNDYEVPQRRDDTIRYSYKPQKIEPTEEPKTKEEKQPDSSSKVKYSERRPTTDSYDSGGVSETIRSYLQQSRPSATLMSNSNISFVNKLEQHIKDKRLSSASVYKAAHIDRRLFSKMICNRDYQPSKDTVLALIFALKLSFTDAKDLLERAGYTLSHSIKRDIILEYFIREGVYNLNNINAFLYNMDEKVIGRGE